MSPIVRKQISIDGTEVFQIDSPTTAFLVKNYTSGPIYVSVGNQFVEADSTMIAANTAEVVVAGDFRNTITVHAPTAGIVEVGRFDGRCIFPLDTTGVLQEVTTESDAVLSIASTLQSVDNRLDGMDSTLTSISERLALSEGNVSTSPFSINANDGGLDVTVND